MRTGTFTDKGHYSRKAVFYAYGVITLIPHILATFGTWLDTQMINGGHKLHVWSHPCLYRPKDTKPPRKDGKEW